MVVTQQTIWRWCVGGFSSCLLLASNLGLSPSRAAYNAATTTNSAPLTQSTKKTTGRTRPRPKPVPLDALDPVPIEAGEGTPLGTFFQALANLQSPSADTSAPSLVRIMHFGDSHVASDYWAGVLRAKLQERFGNAGPGFVLAGRPWSSIRYADAESLDGKGWRTDGLRAGENDGVIGLGGLSTESFREAEPASALATFSQFDIFAATSPGSNCLQVQVDDADVHDLTADTQQVIPSPPVSSALVPEPSSKSLGGGAADPPEPMVQPTTTKRKKRRKAGPPVPPFKPWPADAPLDLLELTNPTPLATGPHRISVRSSCGSTGRLLGLELYSGAKGVLYDTDGVNGARMSDLEKPMPALRRALLQKARPALIIVSYGTNDIGMRGFSSSEYEERAFQILRKLKADAGDASILVTGPTDRGSPRKRTRALIQAGQAALQPALRKAALRAGCAYWDQQAAMGGPGSMTRWVRAGLANYDYVHFSALGYTKLADMLYDQLIAKYSEFRKTQAAE
jgi:lysophospholipase L1-like esterase